MVGLHHWLNGHEFEQALGVGDGQGSLTCFSPWGHKESYMTTGKNLALARLAFVSKIMSLLFNMLSRLVITFLPTSSKEKASFNFMAAVTICSDFGPPPKIKSVTVSTVSPSICHEVMGLNAMILVF